jgi:alkylation response protein AidB-like acyl-CoA dehydrogenase
MELDLTSDQELLRVTTARFVTSNFPLTQVRQFAEGAAQLPTTYLSDAAGLGWFAMLIPDEFGGGSVSGEGLRDLAIIAEERGRELQPGPFTSTNVVAAAIAESGSAEQKAALLPSMAQGELVASWVLGDPMGDWVPGANITATKEDGGFTLSGQTSLVQDGVLADWLLVTASDPDGLTQFLIPSATSGVTVIPLAGHDITQRLARVQFDQVRVPATSILGVESAAALDVERQFQIACVLVTAEAVGAMDALFEKTRQYAIDRIAFGRPIGSFQAVKHQLADLSLTLEGRKAIAVAAARVVQERQADAGEIVSMAKAWIGDAGIDIAQGCFQVFGGIGYTWEHDLHLFLRRMTMNGLLFGQSDWHRERICRMQGL